MQIHHAATVGHRHGEDAVAERAGALSWNQAEQGEL